MKKLFVTSFCAATLFATSFTAADAASLNKEVEGTQNLQNFQVLKGENYNGVAIKLINQISLNNGDFNYSQFENLVKNSLNKADAFKVIQSGKVVQKQNNETTNNQVEKEVKTPQATTNATKAPVTNNNAKAPTNATKAPVTNNNTQAPTKANNQQAATPAKTPTTNANGSVSDFEKQVVDLTNAERAKEGLSPLQIDNSLMAVAQAKSEDMAKNNYFDHQSPTYGSPFDQMKSAGIQYKSAGENIAQGQRTPQEVVQAWMDSPGHRQNIMNPNYTHIGVGYVENGNYWTQQFIQK